MLLSHHTRLKPEKSLDEIAEKVALFNEIVAYAKDPNSYKPAVKAYTIEPKRPSDFSAGQTAVTARFKSESPYLQELVEDAMARPKAPEGGKTAAQR
jgi:hypothetical protein